MNIIPFTNRCRPVYPIGENVVDAMDYINQVTPFIKNIVKNHPVNIWCSGSSGAILSAFLVKNIDNQCIICHVKKSGESAHHGNSFDRIRDRAAINIILDDFMRTGETIERIWNQASHYCNSINILVLTNAYQEPWKLSFVPNNLIIEQESIHSSWKDLIPSKIEQKKEELIDIEF